MMRGSGNSLRNYLHTEVCMENSMPSTYSSTDLAGFLPLMEPLGLSAMDLHTVNLEKEHYGFSEPTSVLDMHMAPSPGSSPSRSSVNGSLESSSAKSAQSFSGQSIWSRSSDDSPPSYPEERNSVRAKSSWFHFGAGNDHMATSWEDPHESVGNIFGFLVDGAPASDTQTASSFSSCYSTGQQMENSGGDHVQDLQFSSDNMDLAELESLIDQEVLTDPLSQLFNVQNGVEADPLSQMLDSQLLANQGLTGFLQNRTPEGGPEGGMMKQCSRALARFQQCQESVLDPETMPQEETGLYLVQLLLGCADAVETGNSELGRQMVSRLSGLASPFGDTMQRIAVYFGDALADQVAMITDTTYIHTTAASSQPKSEEALSPLSLDSHVAYQAYYQVLPYVKFAHFTANQVILEAVGCYDRIHVVDLDIGQGLQWPSFIQSLSVRGTPCHIKITGVGPDRSTLQQTGRRLCEFAASLHVLLEFHFVIETHLENLDAGALRVHLGESLAVNCANVLSRSLGSPQQRALEGVLSMVNSLNPVVVAVVEVESHDNLPSFRSRFVEALHYYSALFDCLEATLGRSSTERLRIERIHFASSIGSILAPGKSSDHSVRHIRSEGWQMCFRQTGFKEFALSGYAVYQAKLLLGLYHGAYKLTGNGAALSLGWQDTPIVSVSAWTC